MSKASAFWKVVLLSLLPGLLILYLASCGGGGGGSDGESAAILRTISVTPSNPSTSPGTTQLFKATGTYSENATVDVTSSVTWTSSEIGVATIDSTGIANPVAAGSTTINATFGTVSGSTTLTVTNPAAVLLDVERFGTAGPFGALMVNNDELLLPLVERDASGDPSKMTGVLWMNRHSGANLLVYFGNDGMPTKAVVGDYILLFSNWSPDGASADIAKIYIPTNYIEVFKRETTVAQAAFTLPEFGTCFPACDTDTENLAELLKMAGLGISLGTCGVATTVSLGAMAIPCAGVIITSASLITGVPAWLEDLPGVADVVGCAMADPVDCISVALDMSGRTMNLLDQQLDDNVGLVVTANIFLTDSAQPSGVVQVGTGLPALPETYECTPGGSMSYLPCYPDGVRECQADYTWGPCIGASCTYTYSTWTACQSNNTQTRTVLSSSPEGCSGTPVLTQSCTPTPASCMYTYSDWAACQPDNTQSRTVLSVSPTGCVGTPILSQSCTYQSNACCACSFDVYCSVFGPGGCWRCSNSTYSGGVCQSPYGALTSDGACTCDPELYQVCQ